MRFVCETCGFVVYYEEHPDEVIECEECDGLMYVDE